MVYQIAANAIAVIHLAYVGFVVLGFFAILAGIVLRWEWIRNAKFRLIHLAMIGIVVLESVGGMTCPLTTWEAELRRRAGQQTTDDDFIASLVHQLMFFDLPQWVFTTIYIVFGLGVFATFLIAPPRFRSTGSNSS